MSSTILSNIQNKIYFYGNASFLFVGNIGNAFIIIIFSRQRKTACSIYLISEAVVNFVFLIINAYFQLFPYDYSDGTLGSTIYCKISAYILNIVGQEAKTMLIFASIDRFLITCDRASLRALSNTKRTKYFIGFSFIFWSLITLHVPIMRTVNNGRCAVSGIYSTIFALLFVSLFPLFTLAIFGYLTHRNLKKRRNRIHPIGHHIINTNDSVRRRDRDLLIVVIAQTIAYVCTTILYPTILLEKTISQYIIPNKSIQYSQIESFILTIGYLLLYFSSVLPFYTYIIVSKSFRQDLKYLIISIYHKITGKRHVENVSVTNQTVQ